MTAASITISRFSHTESKDESIKTILDGLTSDHKNISSRYFYDEIGSKLFEEITFLPEYYLTRTEKNILKQACFQIAGKLKDGDIIELGSGGSSKISLLLESIPEAYRGSVRYIPVDVNQVAIENSAKILINKFPGLKIHGVVADFEKQLNRIPGGAKKLICFFGSTIGNLSRKESQKFMADLGRILQTGGMLLLGVDMVKSKDMLEKAYNDSQKITEKFNRNILNVINNLVGTNFEPALFDHIAFYNEDHSRIEMHLKAMESMEISSPHLKDKIIIRKGETIHTENSHKFTSKHIDDLARAGGLEIKKIFTDNNKWYSLIQFFKSA
jgi:L-histidine N-alpha-methyltransferase